MNLRIAQLLLAGEYVCPVRYPVEHEVLLDTKEQEDVNQWLSKINMRLARVGEEGAFFMAPSVISLREITQVKGELLKFRDEYGPAVQLLDFIRQTDAGAIGLSPGEYLSLYQLESAVAQSTMLESQLKGLIGVISNAAQRNTNHENLRRLLEHLSKDGYVHLVNKDTSTYQVTGKIDQLYAVLQFLDENKVIPQSEVDDQEGEDQKLDLVDEARLTPEGDTP
jgi:hypothetical protein